MASLTLQREDAAGLALAALLHAGLLALLVWQPAAAPLIPPPERISVTLTEDVGLTSTSPEPLAQAAPPAAPEVAPLAEPEPAPQPQPQPKVIPRIKPELLEAPLPRPVSRPAARPVPQPRLAPTPPPRAAARPAPVAPLRTATRSIPGRRISDDFLRGVPNAQTNGAAKNPPAAAAGPAVRSALLAAVSRSLKPRWVAPQGAEADRLVTYVTWSLNQDGSLAAPPRVVRQEGISDANRPQAARHAEQAVRAIQLAQPFNLPDEYYDAWKRIVEFRFDRKLSQ
jgi:hypothetical protein